MEKKERVFIIIDGNNFYHRLKELQLTNLSSFDYEKFAQFLIGRRLLVSKNYYIGAIREERNNPKSKELMIGQQKLIGKLQKENWVIRFGHMLKTDDYHEKGVDVQIATDLLIGAYENFYDTAILVSSDTDLIPAIKYIKHKGKKLEYVGFSHAPSLGMQKYANLSVLLRQKDINNFSQTL